MQLENSNLKGKWVRLDIFVLEIFALLFVVGP